MITEQRAPTWLLNSRLLWCCRDARVRAPHQPRTRQQPCEQANGRAMCCPAHTEAARGWRARLGVRDRADFPHVVPEVRREQSVRAQPVHQRGERLRAGATMRLWYTAAHSMPCERSALARHPATLFGADCATVALAGAGASIGVVLQSLSNSVARHPL